MQLLDVTAVRHEEVPGEREPRTAESLPGQTSPGVSVSQCYRLRQDGGRAARLSHLGTHHQRRRHGHAQI